MPFNPDQPFEVVADSKPAFDPSQPFETVEEPTQPPDEIKAAPTILGELRSGKFGDAAQLGYEAARRQFSGVLGPTTQEKSEQAIAWGKNPDGTTHYEYRPLGDRMEREQGLMTSPFVSDETMLHPDAHDSQIAKLGKALFNTSAGLVGSLTSPGTAILGLAGAGSATLGRVASGVFGLDMAAHLPETFKQVQEADKTPAGSQERIEAGLNMITGLVMTHLATRHALTPEAKVAVDATTTAAQQARTTAPATAAALDEITKQTSALPPPVVAPQVEPAPESFYKFAVKSESGKIFTGKTHEAAMAEMEKEPSEILAKGGRGYVTGDGRFLGLLAVAREELLRNNAAEQAAIRQEVAPKITGPVLTDNTNTPLAEGKVGQTHANLTSEALPKFLEANPEADPTSMQHQFRDSEGNIVSRADAWETAKAAGQIKPEVLEQKAGEAKPELQSQDLVQPDSPVTRPPVTLPDVSGDHLPPVIPATPLPESAPPPSKAEVAKGTGRSDEEKAAKIAEGTQAIREQVAETGFVPAHNEIHGALGDATAAKALRTELQAKLATDYPPEPLPEGASEDTRKNPLTGDELPVVTSVDDRGVTVTKPRFTNDPNLTAQQIDTGAIGTDKANRLYVPDDYPASEKINPAINLAKDKENGRYYVSSVDSEYGHVAKPDDFAGPYREAKAFAKAHQLVLGGAPDEVQKIANAVGHTADDSTVGQALAENGFAEDAVTHEPDVTEGEGAEVTGFDRATKPQVKTMLDALQRVKVIGADGKVLPNAVGSLLKAIVNGDLPVLQWTKVLAKNLLDTGIDLSKLEVQLKNQPNARASGRYVSDPNDVTAGKLEFNLAVNHEGGALATLMHEIAHHVTLVKLDPGYERTPVEQKAYDNLQKLLDHAAASIFEKETGRAGTPEEVAAFQKSQASPSTDAAQNRNYYGLGSLHEFVAELLTNSRFMKALSDIPPLKGVGVSGKFKDLLAAARDLVKTLFTGKVSRNSTLDQAADQALQFINAAPTDPARAFDSNYGPYRPAETVESRDQLEDRGRAIGLTDTVLQTMTTGEIKQALGAGDTGPIATDQIKGEGWLTPEGKFIALDNEGSSHWFDPGFGGHERTAVNYLEANDPQGSAELELKIENEPQKEDGSIRQGVVQKFMEKRGWVRVTGGNGDTLYITGKPSAAQRRALIDTAKEQKTDLVWDRGARQQTLFSPADAFSRAALPPTTTNPAAVPQVDLSARKAGQRIAYGYDSVNNIANNRGKQEANSVALDFGKAQDQTLGNKIGSKLGLVKENAPTEAQTLDRAAAPFVVEAGGDREELVRDLNQVANSGNKELAAKYTPIIQHALDNFDRLNEATQHYREVIKDQLTREQKAGVSIGELDNYVTRLLERPDAEDTVLPGANKQGGGYILKGRKFEKLSDAIAAGFSPKTTDIVDLTQKRVESGERLVQQRLFETELRNTLVNGKPVIGDTEEYESTVGKKETAIPAGYSTVQTGGRPLVVNSEVAPVFRALYGDSTINQFLKSSAGFLKRNTLVFDTYHVGRIMFKELAYSKGAERFGYNKGLSLLEYKPEDIARAVASGDISQSMADYTNEKLPSGQTRREAVDMLLGQGLNVGRVSDNLLSEHSKGLPFLKDFNPWVFQKLSRGAMIQTALENFERNLSRFPERGAEENARQTAKEYNEVFGNLQNQGIFTNKNYQDLARSLVLAPQWAESQLRAELRGYGQVANVGKDLLNRSETTATTDTATGTTETTQGKWDPRLRLGTVAQGQLTVVLGMLAANQIANYLSTGHSTFENKDGHILDAFIPGGRRGFFFSPLEIGGEYAHMASRYFSQHQTPMDVLTSIASNKLGPVGRAASDLLGGRDYSGRPFATTGDRIRATLTDLIPLPIGLSGTFERDPRQATGFRLNRQSGAAEKQLLQSAGLKVTPAMSSTSEMFALAYPYRSDRSYQGPVDYRDLRSALDNEDTGSIQSEIALLASRGKTKKEILSAAGIGTSGLSPQMFTSDRAQEGKFVKALTPDQKALYHEAQQAHKEQAKALIREFRTIPVEVKDKLKANTKPQSP